MALDAFVGRDRELGALRGWLDDARTSRPRLVLIGGEPGAGKSRLADELAAEAGAAGVAVVRARAVEDGGTPPFWLWRQLTPPPAPRGADRPDGDGTAPPHPGAPAERFALFDRIATATLARAAPAGLVVVLDDVHWADEPSLLVLRHLVRVLRSEPVLVLVTYRAVADRATPAWPAVVADLAREPLCERLALGGFSPAETAACLRTRAAAPVTDEFARAVHDRTGGNPLFVTELGRSLRGGATAAGTLGVPATVQEVTAARVARLSPPAQRFLAAASVLGDRFGAAVAAALVERPLSGCLALLDEAVDAGLLVAVGAGDWRFSHGLVRDAVEARLGVEQRVAWHRAAARAIEAAGADRLDDRLADLARHWAAVAAVTGDGTEAVRWCVRAADHATRALADEEAARLLQLALDAGGPGLDPVTLVGVLGDLARAQWRSARADDGRATCGRGIDVARGIGRADLAGELALIIEAVGDLAADLELRRWCQDALGGLGRARPALRARLLARVAEASVYVADYDRADEASRAARALAEEAGDPDAVVAALAARQLVCAGPEHGDERAALAERMSEVGTTGERRDVELRGRLWSIDLHWERGELAAIAPALGRLDWCATRVGGPLARWHVLITRAALAQALGDFDTALAVARQAFESIRASGNPAAFGSYAALVAVVGHHVGHDRSGSLDLFGRAPRHAGDEPPAPRRSGVTQVRDELFAAIVPAQILADLGRLDEAAAAYRRAGPPPTWQPPPYFRTITWATGAAVAVALGRRGDVEWFRAQLLAEKGRHAVAGAGPSSYQGPVELHLGRCSAFLGRWEDAERELRAAQETAAAAGAAGFDVEAGCELADVLVRQRRLLDARPLAERVRAAAERLGMAPWAERAAAPATTGAGAEDDPLTPREREVAALVARGLTNRQIAEALYVSERTAQNHVQHILTKTGCANRSQITAWVLSRDGTGPTPGRRA
jgi:ATP/maltotriose-dependent transcriptional regulator MalT